MPGTRDPSDYKERLSNGAVVVFGEHMPEIVAGLQAAGELAGQLIVGSIRAEDLALPRTLMPWAVLIFKHRILLTMSKRGPSQDDLDRWNAVLFTVLPLAEGLEPEPASEFIIEHGSSDVMLRLSWSAGDDSEWEGVYSTQVKRVAVALDRRYQAALRA